VTLAATVKVDTDGSFHCWLCLHNYSLHLHVRPENRRLLTRAHDTKKAWS
jgi:hypothetical protein